MRFHTQVDISQHRALTPEGFLVCKDVAIARTGNQTYFDGEVPVTADQNGAITIKRNPEEVFSPAAMASFEGKPITMKHPEDAVTPENWRDLSIGHVQNVRQGTGLESDALYADFVIMDKAAISDVRDNLIKEVSCGYEADYVESGPGNGSQTNIRGNHVALVDKGRCGSLCAIHDHKVKDTKSKGGSTMKDLFKKFFGGLTADEQKAVKEEIVQDPEMSDARFKALEASVSSLTADKKARDEEFEKKAEEEKKAADKRAKDMEEEETVDEQKENETDEEYKERMKDKKNKDCNYGQSKDAAPVLQDVLYRSSIMAPDLSRPTLDSAKKMTKKTFDETCCLIKRKSLDRAASAKDTEATVSAFVAKGTDFFTADCQTVDAAFISVSEVLKHRTKDSRAEVRTMDFGKPTLVASINAANKEFYDKRGR